MNQNLKELLDKANELRALFIFGQRVIPFLEEIFIFVSEIEPLLEEINVSIAENLKKMPNATKQLSKVTEATELATNEIMDILDNLAFKTDVISNNLKSLNSIKDTQMSSALKLLEIIHQGIQSQSNLQEVLPEISKVIELIKENENNSFSNLVEETNSILQSINLDSSSIMMSLQVQDITSQQLAAVNHLIETVQQKLMKVIEHFNKADVATILAQEDTPDSQNHSSTSNISKLHRSIAFDPDAVNAFTQKEKRQTSVDDVIKNHLDSSNDDDVVADQDDIDKLFSGQVNFDDLENQVEENEQISNENSNLSDYNSNQNPQNFDNKANVNEAINNPTKVIDESDLDEPFSQDDIDALFGK